MFSVIRPPAAKLVISPESSDAQGDQRWLRSAKAALAVEGLDSDRHRPGDAGLHRLSRLAEPAKSSGGKTGPASAGGRSDLDHPKPDNLRPRPRGSLSR